MTIKSSISWHLTSHPRTPAMNHPKEKRLVQYVPFVSADGSSVVCSVAAADVALELAASIMRKMEKYRSVSRLAELMILSKFIQIVLIFRSENVHILNLKKYEKLNSPRGYGRSILPLSDLNLFYQHF